ncbi:MAG TPA: bifunctional homocysteine S-methyltransferase/methylenetetrahydrofolate reductase [Candidatus Polarisedimenticolia bacterium]|nr:bifunctional homocysteine S-methyltransferase/methylenetetrahydrofolate reductase [Candidatus Polarisedimenticolia bacterium]
MSHGKIPFLEALKQGPLVADGAMGTQLYERGYFITRSFDEANLGRPDLVLEIHRDYLAAGAQILESNTFGANRELLGRYGAQDRLREINRAGVRLARQAAGTAAYVAGSVGPTGRMAGLIGGDRWSDLEEIFKEQIEALLEEGVDLLVLETFFSTGEIEAALKAARALYDGPIVAQMTFSEDRPAIDGLPPSLIAEFLRDRGADVAGVNCAEGPAFVFETAREMLGRGVPVSAQPNAGRPRRLDERTIYMTTPEYFGVYARRFFQSGVALVGGCCGTGPEHIRSVVAAAAMLRGGRVTIAAVPGGAAPEVRRHPVIPMEAKSPLGAKLARVQRERVDATGPRRPLSGPESFVVSVEVNPDPGLDLNRPLRAAALLKRAGVDVINIADGPRAAARMSNLALALKAKGEVGIDVILHACCRDRNLLGLHSDLLGAWVLGIRNLVVITGDPPKMGDYPAATAVFDLDSIGLLGLAEALNRGVDPAGRELADRTGFLLGCGAEPAAHDYDRELQRLGEKKRAGAEFVMTQPVYDPAILRRFLDDTRSLGLPILVGLCPLASARNAEFLHNEVPGMQIPEATRARMAAAATPEEGRRQGVLIAREMLETVKNDVAGAYLMPQFGRFRSAVEVLQAVGYDFAPEDAREG